MRKLFIVLFAILSTNYSYAEERSDEQLMTAAKEILDKRGNLTRNSGNDKISILRKTEQLSIIGYKGGACAFIANDDSFEPILGYTDEAMPNVLPPALEWWIKAMNNSLAEALEKGKRQKNIKPAAQHKEAVDIMLTTKWNQNTPYNNLCPQYKVNNTTQRYVTGCVATSMAQVMNYHEFPTKGKSSRSYYLYDDKGNRTRVYANFGITTYDWNNMLDTYGNTNSYNADEAKAVATLMYHCGVAVEMQYAEDGSAALSQDASIGLKKYFGYDESTRYYYRDIYHVDEWMDIIYRELNDSCPIIYGGVRNDGGHSFVLDGYNASGLVHVNWGWGGSGNGYFDISKLDGYKQYQDMVTVRKEGDERINYNFASTWGLVDALSAKLAINSLTITTGGFANFNEDTFNGYIGVMLMDTTTLEKTLLSTYDQKITDFYCGYGFSKFTCTTTIGNTPNGTYRMYLATKDDKDTEWQPVRSKEGICNSYILNISNGHGTLKAENSSAWIHDISTNIEPPAAVSASQGGITKVFLPSGTLIYSTDSRTFNIKDIPANGLLIVKDGTKTIKIVK